MTARTEKTWRDTILFKPKLRTYMKYKTLFGTEEYVKCLMSRKQRSILTQFRSLLIPELVCLVYAEDAIVDEFNFFAFVKHIRI